jgi:alkanesulfonate monooxygenase SsuD/methylene tetrahydromethanopterin reductase-like flavin-dependent oxidoreductase (luciferase family)
VYLAEHHAAEDGYLPAPLLVGSAIASRTARLTIHFSALVAVLHHPVQLAEELAVLDLLSGGRIEMTLGIGYRQREYDLFGVRRSQRVKLLEEVIAVLDQAWSGEPFEYRGQTLTIKPTPVQKPRPPLYIGGSTEASAIRAARLGDNFLPATAPLFDVYAAERRRLGQPVPTGPRPRGPLFLFVTDDPDRTWTTIGPNLLYATNTTAAWALERGVGATPYPELTDVEELKGNDQFQVVTPDECVSLIDKLPPDAEITLHPLFGGLDPELGSRCVELFVSSVLPELAERGRWTEPAPGEPARR